MVFEGWSGLLGRSMSRTGPRVFEGTGLSLGGHCRGCGSPSELGVGGGGWLQVVPAPTPLLASWALKCSP